jgi:hypothetical protein
MTSRATLSAAFFSLVFLLAGCSQHKQSASVPIQARAPGIGGTQPFALVKRVGPAILNPDSGMTPSKADTLNVNDLTTRYIENCPAGRADCTYSQSHRNVPKSVHTGVYDEYKVPDDERNIQDGEVDHLYPLVRWGFKRHREPLVSAR